MRRSSAGDGAGAVFVFVLLFALPVALGVLFIKGSLWAVEHLLPGLNKASALGFLFSLFVLGPLSLFRRTRGFAAKLLMPLSYLFGLTTWLLGFLMTYALWGVFAVVAGLFMFGLGVVPIAMLATAVNGMWPEFFALVASIIITFGARAASIVLSGFR